VADDDGNPDGVVGHGGHCFDGLPQRDDQEGAVSPVESGRADHWKENVIPIRHILRRSVKTLPPETLCAASVLRSSSVESGSLAGPGRSVPTEASSHAQHSSPSVDLSRPTPGSTPRAVCNTAPGRQRSI
jgi:hypothetical protein